MINTLQDDRRRLLLHVDNELDEDIHRMALAHMQGMAYSLGMKAVSVKDIVVVLTGDRAVAQKYHADARNWKVLSMGLMLAERKISFLLGGKVPCTSRKKHSRRTKEAHREVSLAAGESIAFHAPLYHAGREDTTPRGQVPEALATIAGLHGSEQLASHVAIVTRPR